MRNRLLAILLAWFSAAAAQQLDPRSSLKIDFPTDSPLAVVSADMGDSRTMARGSAMVIDLHTSLTLRNSAPRRLRGVTLLVTAQEVAAGGRASVSVPSLNVGSGETFPVRIDLRLLRPLFPAGPLVVVSLDGALFEDLSFYGPNKLNSQRSMTVWEMQARRDRQHFKSVLAAKGQEALRQALLASLARQSERPRVNVQLARGGRATNQEPERSLQFAFLQLPDSPIEAVGGSARVAGNEAQAPTLEVRNRSGRPVRYFEVGWIIQDSEGQDFLAGSVPASDPDLNLAPGQTSRVLQSASLRFSAAPGRPLAIAGMTGFVSQVEFRDGSVWIPSRTALNDPKLSRIVEASPEEQRLTELYRKKGLAAVLEELKKF
ncbi:MAG TPA: hypothetical protein VLH09_00895 [Bryobacteraceae bacterium]|nr:hypothetical protein [Bryobacteraceae bacterium]